MKTTPAIASAAILFVTMTSWAQQATNLQQSQTQAQTQLCDTTSTQNSANNAGPKVPSKLKQALNKRLQATIGVSTDDLTAGQQKTSAKPQPCPSKTNLPNPSPQTPLPQLKLPPDTTVTLHCNPTTPSPKDANGHPTTLILPDPHDYAVPKATDFEVDNVVPDLAAHTACFLIKVDPKTNKSFVAQ